MNKYYILSLDSFSTAFSVLGIESKFKFSMKKSGNDDVISDLKLGDYVVIYLKKPINRFKIILQVDNIKDTEKIMKKILEVDEGTDEFIADRDDLEDIELIEISEAQYKKILFAMLYSFQQIKKDVEPEKKFRNKYAENILLYGVPGCGKSHTIKTEYCNDDERMERVVFHPDYTYSDFVGQILPSVEGERIKYNFEQGPFTRILKKAIQTPDKDFYLVIEEINRGNAPAIFGDIFQLLDREENGWSEYGVSNENISKEIYNNENTKIKIPSNLFILATMNTSDQNVFTLDTAFKRRWTMKMIENNIDTCKYAQHQICAWNITWGTFAKTINRKIIELGENNLSSEDNRLGAYFVKEVDLNDAERFGEKVLMYLWNDAFKFDHDKIFKAEYRTLDELIFAFTKKGFEIFNDDISFSTMSSEIDDIVETDDPTAEQYLENKNPEMVNIYRNLFDAISARIPNAYDSSTPALGYVRWSANNIGKKSFANIQLKRNDIIIYCETPQNENHRSIGEELPIDNHKNHYFKIIFDITKQDQIINAVVDSYNQLRVEV